MRTTLDIDEPILKEIRRLRDTQGRSMGRIVSDLLAQALANSGNGARTETEFRWHSRPVGARVDLADREAIHDAMEDRRGRNAPG